MNTIDTQTQLEFKAVSTLEPCSPDRRQRRLPTASFWFQRMRQIVDCAQGRRPKLLRLRSSSFSSSIS
jgi:hypothetical protein